MRTLPYSWMMATIHHQPEGIFYKPIGHWYQNVNLVMLSFVIMLVRSMNLVNCLFGFLLCFCFCFFGIPFVSQKQYATSVGTGHVAKITDNNGNKGRFCFVLIM